MRSTLVLDDHLFKKARERAAALNTTISDVVNQALREVLTKPLPKPTRFQMITFGDAAKRHRHEPADFADNLADDDAASLDR